ncbi:MAG: hypothetical protein K2K20_00410 [Lachnospiraceae bacterium]|nr:hypothetical protein [Lachnospiraceae bacterium]
MIENRETIILKDGMDTVLQQLNALHGMMSVLQSGLEAEETEEKALDCMECIDECVKNIRSFVTDTLKEFDDCVNEK